MIKIDKGKYAKLNFLDAILYNEAGERRQKVIILTEEYFIVSYYHMSRHIKYNIYRSWTPLIKTYRR